MSQNENSQQNFITELIDRTDRVAGLRLTFNKYLVLFLKCLYIRKRKKFITLLELLVPLLIFNYAIYLVDQVTDISKWKPSNNTVSTFGRGLYVFADPADGRDSFNPFYYDYNNTNVVSSDLEAFLKRVGSRSTYA